MRKSKEGMDSPHTVVVGIVIKSFTYNSKLHRIMLDTSALDYIYDNDLSAEVNYYIHDGYVSLYITHIQIAEVLGNKQISQDAIIRKCRIIQTILSIDVKVIPLSVAYIPEPVT